MLDEATEIYKLCCRKSRKTQGSTGSLAFRVVRYFLVYVKKRYVK